MIYNILATEMRITHNNNIELNSIKDIQNKITTLMIDSVSYATKKRIISYFTRMTIAIMCMAVFIAFQENIKEFIRSNISSRYETFIYKAIFIIMALFMCLYTIYFVYRSHIFPILYYAIYLRINSMYKSLILILIFIIILITSGILGYSGIYYALPYIMKLIFDNL